MKIDLSPYRINVTSQFGEDLLIKKLFELLKIDSGYLVEFGAWDGRHLSNSYYHLQNNPYFGTIQIEKEKERFDQLADNINALGCAHYVAINGEVDVDGPNSLNVIFDEENITDIALLSIDVDGNDLEIFNSLDTTKYRPAIVIIEFGQWNQEKNLNYLVDCFEFKGYNLVHITGNFIFVDKKFSIRAVLNIHQLMPLSGCPEYMYHYGNIDINRKNELEAESVKDPDFYSKTAGEQLVEFNISEFGD